MKANPLLSYLRHVISGWILILLEKYQFPVEGREDAVNFIALSLISVGTWAFVKYVMPYLKEPRNMALLLAGASTVLFFPSCAGTVRSPLTGIEYTDGKPSADAQTQLTLLWRLKQLLSGVAPEDILKNSLPTIDPRKGGK